MVLDNIITAAQLATSGRARALAVSSANRSALLAGVPSFAESGAPGLRPGLVAGALRPGRPAARDRRALGEALRHALQTPTVDRPLRESGAEPIGGSAAELADFRAAEIPKSGHLVRISGTSVD